MSATRQWRQRSSTAASNPPESTKDSLELQELLNDLCTTIRSPPEGSFPDLPATSKQVQSIRRFLIASSSASRANDDFRHLAGFQVIIETLRTFSGYYNPSKRTHKEKINLFEVLDSVLDLLAQTFREHNGNRRYFKKRVEGGGWAALEQVIASIGIGGSESDIWGESQLLGKLLSFALDDKRFESLCQKTIEKSQKSTHVQEPSSTLHKSDPSDSLNIPVTANNEEHTPHNEQIISLVEGRLQEMLKEGALLHNPEMVPILVDFWKSLSRPELGTVNPCVFVVILSLSRISSVSSHNLHALHCSGILSVLLPLAIDANTSLGSSERRCVENLCTSLISLGVNSLADSQYLITSANPAAADLLLRCLKSSQRPASIEFDLSINGYASVELSTLGRPFPPPSSSAGYTFAAWIYVDTFDPNTHTTIFGAFDVTQTCFVLGYLERDTKNFILQTSITNSRPSIRFKQAVFEEKKWYHIAVVHRRPRTMSSSKAALYVNGEFSEQLKCHYPSHPPPENPDVDSLSSFTSSIVAKPRSVQAFLGTPPDLSSRLGRGVVFSRWSLASAHLIEDVLSDDLIAVYYHLGPKYNGNFQDSLGSFQTYEASAALGRRNEQMHPGKDEESDILRAIRAKAGSIVPENRIIFSLLPSSVFGDDSQGKDLDRPVVRGLNRTSYNNLYQYIHSTGSSLAVNSSLPSLNEALIRSNGSLVMTGDPIVTIPQSLDETFWRLGGHAGIVLKLVEDASTKEETLRAVEILFQSIKGSWRNSEAMEKENGYAILTAILRGKIGAGVIVTSKNSSANGNVMNSEDRDQLAFQLLSLVLEFLGYDHVHPEDSFIINPLAYRVLLVDFDLWRKTAPITQQLYYRQFITFGVNSKYHQFNSRRLFRMRIVKRFLDALKAESFTPDVFPFFMEALGILVKCNMTADVFRFLALFTTYAFHKNTSLATRSNRAHSGTPPPRSNTVSGAARRPTIVTHIDTDEKVSSVLTRRQIGHKILEMYTNLLCEKGNYSTIRKFGKTVTSKWLLHLLTEDDPEVVVHTTKIIARLIVVLGPTFATKFITKSGGFTIMRYRLKRWWDIPTMWALCFSILFGRDVADIDFEQSFELFNLLETFTKTKIIYPAIFPVITTMIQHGLKQILHYQIEADSPLATKPNGQGHGLTLDPSFGHSRRRSMSLTKELESRQTHKPKADRINEQASVLNTVVRFLGDTHSKHADFRDFAISSDYVRLLLGALYPVIVSSDAVTAETELNSRDSALNFEGDDVLIRPLSRVSTMPTPIVRTSSVETMLPPSPTSTRAKPLRRGSSFILLTSRPSEFSPSTARLNSVMSPKKKLAAQKVSNALVEGVLELVINVFIDQVMTRKDFPGFGIFLKVPPGFQEHQAYFESYILRNTISQLWNTIQLDQKSLWETKNIQNMGRFVSHIGEAVFEGWFLGGAEPLLDFAGNLLEYLQRPEIAKLKTVRLCNQAILTIKTVFVRIVLLRLSELDDPQVVESDVLTFMDRLLYWQTVVLSSEVSDDDFLRLICYQLYLKLVDSRERIRLAAANLWRILLVQKPEETSAVFHNATTNGHIALTADFKKLVELDNETFVAWVDEQRAELDALFFGAMSKTWEAFVTTENERTEETSKSRVARRRDRLKTWQGEAIAEDRLLFDHEISSATWMKNIYASEHLKHQRAQQDQQDSFIHLVSMFSKMDRELHRPCAIFENSSSVSWKLDRTEGRNRMRLRMLPDRTGAAYNYQPKRKTTDAASSGPLKLDTKISITPSASVGATPLKTSSSSSLSGAVQKDVSSAIGSDGHDLQDSYDLGDSVINEEEFELVDDPKDGSDEADAYEDKNRKVMRSLQSGDQVQQVFNIARLVGLETCEGMLILGKISLYIIDNIFQRSDGEIVNVAQAPLEERDPYLQLIAGQKAPTKRPSNGRADQETRFWKWSDVLSISKRRFLFRDVAVEIFFTDGRSYLLTALTPVLRDELYSKIASKVPHTTGGSSLPNPEDSWRLEALKVADEVPATFGTKFGNIFNSSSWNPAMRKWAKGEISNFHYLMLVNTMAGRTFNDLTQYPVFPWVLADYTSEELDLNNPASFRDLSKPMGAQHNSRAADFTERYKAFSEMGDQNTPAFHYGTHYSSAMIVTSYLIRLQPFVKSYLLLQGGSFDHPDRLFYSIERAWQSASKENMSDVRELTPEFFYLSEFLTNNNGYNFGLRQGDGGGIDNVALPPWAKGDPKIFIAKHREALESPYVSQHLHQWIDLVFGCKQRGEAAIENVNVFHHLSYHGAKNLDDITDDHERTATIGIIHNFGQTPHQVFSKPHQARDDARHRVKRLDTSAGSLTRLPFPLLETHERVVSLIYAPKIDRLICAPTFRLNLPPAYDKYLEWGFSDSSVRFYYADSKKPAGLFENLHQGQLSCLIFASSQLLITAGEDCVVSAHQLVTSPGKPVDMTPRASLFGHKTPVTVLAVSKSFSTLLSASTDGTVILWDLNRLEFVRKLPSARGVVECAKVNDVTGDIMICRGQKVLIYTLNGELLLEQNVAVGTDDYVASCAWYEGAGNEWLESDICFTGQRRGVVNCWKKRVDKYGKWKLELVKRLDHVDAGRKEGLGATAIGGRSVSGSLSGNNEAAITCVLPLPQVLYTGDEDGKVFQWDVVQREQR